MKNIILMLGLSIVFCPTFFCSNYAPYTNDSSSGKLDIRLWIQPTQLSHEGKRERGITWNRLIIQIHADDIDTLRDTTDIDMQNALISLQLADIPAGKNRYIDAWTIDSSGDVIHKTTEITVDISASQTIPVIFILNPIVGSIYLQLTDFPTEVDSVLFSFSTNTHTWWIKDQKKPKLNLCLDKISFGMTGTLSIVGYDSSGDTVASWSKNDFTFTNSNTTLEVSFINIGKIDLQVTIVIPGVTVIHGIMNPTDSIGDEQGGLIISEIMYAANDSEYIEIYNPQNDTFSDTIIVQKDNGIFRYFHISIPPQDFYIIGRKNLIWCDTFPSVASALDLSSTTGNWLLLRLGRDSSIIDLVVFQTGTNKQNWPKITSSLKASIVLDSLVTDPEYNNYGRNWLQAQTFIDTTITRQFGTPGRF